VHLQTGLAQVLPGTGLLVDDHQCVAHVRSFGAQVCRREDDLSAGCGDVLDYRDDLPRRHH
jgi:hypothetical protein